MYLPRIVDKVLTHKLSYAGAVAVRGPKWCGKTFTSSRQAASAVYLQDPDTRENNLLLAQTKPSVLLRGAQPRLIDEWQDAPQLWDAVRFAVDREEGTGHYILTGSAVPSEKPVHSGTGRFTFLDMRPMSLAESGDSTGEVSLSALFEEPIPEGFSSADVETLSFLVCRGGWPRAVTTGGVASLELARDYLAVVTEEDISRVDGVARNPRHAQSIILEYARCTATQTSINAMRGDLKTRGDDLSKDTVNSYINALRLIFCIDDLEAWSPSLHARTRVTRTPTRFLCDSSVAAAALGASPELLLKDLSTLGMLFEGLCIRDLRVYAEAMGGTVYHYHDESGLEADAVVQLRDGRYALFEVKLGTAMADEAAKSLHKLANKLDTSIMGAPSFMAVIVPGGYAYLRPDDILVLPITCLGA